MLVFVRVDDRLLHGQIICAWVPYIKADALMVASDEAAGDSLAAEIIGSCGYKGLNVYVKNIHEAAGYITGDGAERIILIVGELKDAMRIFEDGVRFRTLNIGNIHHEDGRKVTPYMIVNCEDERLIEKFRELGVSIDIRDVPASAPVDYIPGKREHAG